MNPYGRKTIGEHADELLLSKVGDLPRTELDVCEMRQYQDAVDFLNRRGRLDVLRRARMRKILGLVLSPQDCQP